MVMFVMNLSSSFLILLHVLLYAQTAYSGHESDLIHALLDGYDRRERPVLEHTDAVIVRLGLAIQQILDVNEKRQTMMVNLWMRQYWHDFRFEWNPDDYGGLRKIDIPLSDHWKPDIVLYNNADKTFSPMHEDVWTVVTSDGNVTVMYPIIYDVACIIDVYHFPFDQQTCHMKFGSWGYSGLDLDLRLKDENAADISNYKPNSGWALVGSSLSRHTEYYGCCSDPFHDIKFHLVIRRQWKMLFFHLLVPCLICNVLALAQFILPCDSGEKVTLAITLFLSMVVYLLLLQEMLPNSANLPVIIHYMIWTLVLVGVSMVVTVLVLHLHHNCNHDNHMQLPHWARHIFLHKISRFLFMHKYITSDTEHEQKLLGYKSSVSLLDDKDGSSSGTDIEEEEGDIKNWSRDVDTKKEHKKSDIFKEIKDAITVPNKVIPTSAHSYRSGEESEPSQSRHRVPDIFARRNTLDVDTRNIQSIPSIKSSMFRKVHSNSKTTFRRNELDRYKNLILFKILKHCEDYKERITEEEKERELQCEWMQLAMVIDRLMLILYLVFTFVILMYLFLSKPSYTEPIIA